MIDTLRDAQDRLAEMHAENLTVASAFDTSYKGLSRDQQRLFRRLGLHPGRDIDAYATAALNDVAIAHARRGLDTLYQHHLLEEPLPGRYRMHDLIQAYAYAVASEDDPADNRRALQRLLNYYLQGVSAAGVHVGLVGVPTTPLHPQQSAAIPHISDRQSALTWLDLERANWKACFDHAVAVGLHDYIVQFSPVIHPYLMFAGSSDQAVAIHSTALRAARATADLLAEARILDCLARTLRRRGEHTSAIPHLTRALTIYRDHDNRIGEASALHGLGSLQQIAGAYASAVDYLTQAGACYSQLGDQFGMANVYNSLAMVHHATDNSAAMASVNKAISLFRALDHKPGEARALVVLGEVQLAMDDYPAAIASLTDGAAVCRLIGDRLLMADALHLLGTTQRLLGDYWAAFESERRSLTLSRDFAGRLTEANALTGIGALQQVTGQYDAASASLEEAIALYRKLGGQHGLDRALATLAESQRLTGKYEAAAASLTEALTHSDRFGNRTEQAHAHNGMGVLLHAVARDGESLSHHRRALQLAQDARSTLTQAHALEGIGRNLLRSRATSHAMEALQEAMRIYRRLGVPEADRLMASFGGLLNLDRSVGDPSQR